VKLVAPADARAAVVEGGGRLYVWPRAVRCCGGRQWLLDAGTSPGARAFTRIHEEDAIEIWASPGLGAPRELHVELARGGRLRAFWDGLAWIA
jgi:hypothetical protein